MRKHRITVLPGDGIGPEIVEPALQVLCAVAGRFGFEVEARSALIGGAAIDQTGVPLPDETVALCKASDAVLLGAVGGPKWDAVAPDIRPETGLLGIRKALGLYANLRPATLHPALSEASPLKESVLGGKLDLMIVRELTGGIYFGQRGREGDSAYDTERYSKGEVERIARVAFALAQDRGKKLCSVDKANVLESSRLWREVVSAVAADYPDVALSHMYVDNAAMQLVRAPGQFDVIVTGNLFGDILSDEASQLTGSIGMLPSASLGDGRSGAGALGLYEPIHGSAPDIAGKGIANPLATILAVAMMLRHSLGEPEAANAIEASVGSALQSGVRTADIARPGEASVGTRAMTGAVLAALG